MHRSVAPLRALGILAFTALFALLPTAAAHITTTVDAPTAPLVVGVPTIVTVHFSEPCFEVLPQELQGTTTVASGLDATAPATFNWTGEEVAFTTAMCDPTALPFALVKASAKLTLIAGPGAPGLTNLTLPVTSFLGGGEEPGDVVDLPVSVAYHAAGTFGLHEHHGAEAAQEDDHDEADGHDEAAGHHHGDVVVDFQAELSTNAVSTMRFEVTTDVGEASVIEAVAVNPPSFTNQSTVKAHVSTTFEPPAGNWTVAHVTVKAFIAPKQGGAEQLLGTATATIDAPEPEPVTSTSSSKSSPAPIAPLALVGLAMLAATRRGK